MYKKGIYKVVANEPLTPDVWRMVLAGDTQWITRPGQFVNIELEGLYLRRPISISDWSEDTITIIYKVVGRGTEQMSRMSEKESNRMSVRLELQADFLAGIWAYHDNRMFNSLENGDIEEGLNVASKIGDDYLQKQAQGYTVPDAFNHGTSAQRVRWLKKGIKSGNVNDGDTFSQSYNEL